MRPRWPHGKPDKKNTKNYIGKSTTSSSIFFVIKTTAQLSEQAKNYVP